MPRTILAFTRDADSDWVAAWIVDTTAISATVRCSRSIHGSPRRDWRVLSYENDGGDRREVTRGYRGRKQLERIAGGHEVAARSSEAAAIAAARPPRFMRTRSPTSISIAAAMRPSLAHISIVSLARLDPGRGWLASPGRRAGRPRAGPSWRVSIDLEVSSSSTRPSPKPGPKRARDSLCERHS